jgi:hypothetical protein
MDKTLAAIKLVGELIIGSHFVHQLCLEGEGLQKKIPFLITGMLYIVVFEALFYWHILR